MRRSNYKWLLFKEEELPELFLQLLKEKNIPVFLGKILWQRGIRTKEQIAHFFHPSVDQLHDPYLFFEMDKAVFRIHQALEKGEKILVYGDYDADGITSTTVMKETLELLGAEIETYLPNRFTDGYGPNQEVYRKKIAAGVQLIITVDNGVSGYEAIDFANQQGVDVIVTDHHELPDQLPAAYAVIHPRHPQGKYPFGDLAGVGVAFKLACALLEEVPSEFLDLVAIGTIADMVPLRDENRVLVSFGLEALRQTERLGLLELLQVSGAKATAVDEATVGFAIGPRLNALGRIEDPNEAIELLTTLETQRAHALAKKLDAINRKRKTLTQTVTTEALQQVDPSKKIQIITSDRWHEGVLGIVAGNIAKKIGQPTLVLTEKEDGIFKGSGRSVDSIDLFRLLNEFKDLMVSFGGHHSACGLSLQKENLAQLSQGADALLRKNQVKVENYLEIDAVLSLADATLEQIRLVDKLAPFGMENARPQFLFKNCSVISARSVGEDNKHLKLSVKDTSGAVLDGIGFGFGPEIQEFQHTVSDIVATLSINEWNQKVLPQLMLKDFQVEGLQIFDYRSKQAQQQLKTDARTLVVSFSARESRKWSKKSHRPIVTYEDRADFAQQIEPGNYEEILLLNCPLDLTDAKQAISTAKVSRVLLLCDCTDDAYLDGVGTREQYARLFRFIANVEQADVRFKVGKIADYLKLPEKLLVFMIQVFCELEFVTIKDGLMRRVSQPEEHPLAESQTYQKRLKKIKTEEFLLLSDLPTLTKWLSSDETESNVSTDQEENK